MANREEEQRWLEEYGHLYRGEWVVIEGTKLISHGQHIEETLKQARAAGIRIPFIARIPSKDEGPLCYGGTSR